MSIGSKEKKNIKSLAKSVKEKVKDKSKKNSSSLKLVSKLVPSLNATFNLSRTRRARGWGSCKSQISEEETKATRTRVSTATTKRTRSSR